MGCCQILFDPAKRGVVGYVCGCGWYGEEPKYVHGDERYDGPQVDYECPRCGETLNPNPLVLGTVKREVIDYAASVAQLFLIHSYSPKGCDCDGCKVIKPLIPGFAEMRDRWLLGSYARREGKERRREIRRMKIDHAAVYTAMVKSFIPNGWEPYTKTVLKTEMRLSSDNRSHNMWLAEKGASQLYWEVLRAVHPEMPAKVRWQDYSSKEEFKAAKQSNGKRWGEIRDGFYTIWDLLKAKRADFRRKTPWWSDETAEDQVKAITHTMSKWCEMAAKTLKDKSRKTAEEIELLRKLAPGGNPVIPNLERLTKEERKALLTKPLQLVGLASAISDLRKIAATRITKIRGKFTSASALMERSAKEEDRLGYIGNFMNGVLELFGDCDVRNSVIESMRITDRDWRKMHGEVSWSFVRPLVKSGQISVRDDGWYIRHIKEKATYMPGLRMVRWEGFGIYEKSTWRYKDFKVLHSADFFNNPEFDIDYGAPKTQEDGSVIVWDRSRKTWVELFGPWVDTSLMTKAKFSPINSFDMLPYSDAVWNENEEEDGEDDESWQVEAYRSMVDVEDDTQAIEEEVEPEIDEDSAVA